MCAHASLGRECPQNTNGPNVATSILQYMSNILGCVAPPTDWWSRMSLQICPTARNVSAPYGCYGLYQLEIIIGSAINCFTMTAAHIREDLLKPVPRGRARAIFTAMPFDGYHSGFRGFNAICSLPKFFTNAYIYIERGRASGARAGRAMQ